MNFTPSQLRALDEIATNKLTVVRAVPGAGKTRVFVEAFKREIEQCSSTRFGVAALSFTNVAHQEISRRMDRAIGPPHFVGTLDAFMWRFVVKPFGSFVGLASKGARLLPKPLDEIQSGPVVKYGEAHWQSTTVFQIGISGGDETTPKLRINKEVLGSFFNERVMDVKRQEWARNGRVTHSDAQFLASCIISGPHGTSVCKLLARRFPVILVDEFQDTGHFLGRALLALLATPSIRGALVGDPDQAIYQFGGASRGLFDEAERIEGSKRTVLDESHRCPSKVAAVTSSLSRSGKTVVSTSDVPNGRAAIAIHQHTEPDLEGLLALLKASTGQEPVVLARKTATVRKLSRLIGHSECPKGCKFAHGINKATERLVAGEPTLAARITKKELGGIIFDDEDIDLEGLRAHSVSPLAWRKACHGVLFEAMRTKPGESWNDWVVRLKERVKNEAAFLGQAVEKLGTKVRSLGSDGKEPRRADRVAATPIKNVEVMTIHQAKGREFPAVVLYIPKPHKSHSPCPSGEWWSDDEESEEREIAFVACSRSKDLLVLAVHRETFDALQRLRPDFIGLFEPINPIMPKLASKRGPRNPPANTV